MAISAGAVPELVSVRALVPVTPHAIGGEAEKRPRESAGRGHSRYDGRIPDASSFVAVPTVDRGVAQLQLVPGFAMVEGVFIEPPHVEVRPQVILMAIGAGVLGDRGVVPPVLSDPSAELLVAVQATLGRDAALAELVARGAVSQALLLRVRLGESSG
jgi:hypothetical protein